VFVSYWSNDKRRSFLWRRDTTVQKKLASTLPGAVFTYELFPVEEPVREKFASANRARLGITHSCEQISIATGLVLSQLQVTVIIGKTADQCNVIIHPNPHRGHIEPSEDIIWHTLERIFRWLATAMSVNKCKNLMVSDWIIVSSSVQRYIK
jgi:hypothetical protein